MPCAALARASAALARRLEAGLHAELGQARGLGARRGVEPRLREQRLAGAQREVQVRRLGGDDDARVVPRRAGALEPRLGGVARGAVAAEHVDLPARLQADACARAGRHADVLAAARRRWPLASSDGSSAAPAAARRALRIGDPRGGARDRRARRARAASIRRASSGSSNCVHQRRSSPTSPPCGSGACQAGATTGSEPARRRSRRSRPGRGRGRTSIAASRWRFMGGEVYGVARCRLRDGASAPGSAAPTRRAGSRGTSARCRRGWSRKKRNISRDASGPSGSVYEPAAAPPDQACGAPCTSQCSASSAHRAPASAARQTVRRARRLPARRCRRLSRDRARRRRARRR